MSVLQWYSEVKGQCLYLDQCNERLLERGYGVYVRWDRVSVSGRRTYKQEQEIPELLPLARGQGAEIWLIRGRAVARSVGFCGSETEVAKWVLVPRQSGDTALDLRASGYNCGLSATMAEWDRISRQSGNVINYSRSSDSYWDSLQLRCGNWRNWVKGRRITETIWWGD